MGHAGGAPRQRCRRYPRGRAKSSARQDGRPAESPVVHAQFSARCERSAGRLRVMAEANERVVGIDLGTTNSLVAYMEGDRPMVIPGEDGSNLVPSVVAIDETGEAIVGNAARRLLIETPERAVYSIKRLMGRGLEDVQDELKLLPFR